MSSESSRTVLLAVTAALIVALAGFFGWQYMKRMDQQLAALNEHVETLNDQVTHAEKRAAEAETQATSAQEQASEAANRAEIALEREQESIELADAALEAEELAKQQETLALSERDKALEVAEASITAKKEALEQQREAERQQQEALEELDGARMETMEARAETRRLKRKMESELDRLQTALGRIAETKRTALGLVMTLDSDHIEFDFNKDTLRSANREVLSKIAGVLLTFNDYGVQIFGHTDDVGSEEYNKGLSKRRAETVKHYLVKSGIEATVLSTLGMGKGSPIVQGTDPESRQRNRRVELAIVFSEGEYEAIQEDEVSAGT